MSIKWLKYVNEHSIIFSKVATNLNRVKKIMENVKVQLKQVLESLIVTVPNKKVGICNNVSDLLRKEFGQKVAVNGHILLKESFVDLGYDEDFPVELHFLKTKEEARFEFYEGGPKWDQKKSKFGQFRLQLVKDIIVHLEK